MLIGTPSSLTDLLKYNLYVSFLYKDQRTIINLIIFKLISNFIEYTITFFINHRSYFYQAIRSRVCAILGRQEPLVDLSPHSPLWLHLSSQLKGLCLRWSESSLSLLSAYLHQHFDRWF